MTTPTNSRCERLTFSGKEEDFAVFVEQFEARIFTLNLDRCLSNEIETPAFEENETVANKSKREKEEAALARQKYMVWCELIQCLDKASINFIRGQKPDGPAAWRALVNKFKSTERPRIHSLLAKMTSLSMGSEENVSEYLTRAELLKLDLEESGEKISNTLYMSMILKGLPGSFEHIATVLTFGTPKTSLI